MSSSWILAASFTATLDRDTVNVGDSVTLSLAFEGGSPKAAPVIPTVDNLRIVAVGIPSTSSQTHVNLNTGEFVSTTTYTLTYSVTPVQPGDYTIPGIKTEVGGQMLASQPLKLKAEAVSPEKQDAFVRLILPKKEMFVGEVMPLQIELYLRRGVGAEEVNPQVRTEGLTVGKPLKGSERDVQLGNTIFHCVQILIPATAIKTGKFNVTADCSLTLQLPSNGRRRDPFDPFGLLGGTKLKPITASTPQPESLTVLDLPKQNRPENFKGAVGNYSLNVTATPTNVTVGDPITVKIQVSGRGQLEGLSLPEQTAWSDLKTYSSDAKVQTVDQLGLQGTKTFEQLVTPQSADIKALPPISFSFFDPDERKYHTINSAPIPLLVKPSGTVVLPSFAASRDENPPPTQDIVHIKQRIGDVTTLGEPLIARGWFLTTQSIPVLAFLGLVVWRKQNEKLANNPRLQRERRVAQTIARGVHDLKYYAAENYSEEFFATTTRLLQEQLGALLDVPASSITEGVVDEQLRPRGVPEQNLTAVRELFHAADRARYAPDHKHGELQALIPKIETTVSELQKLKLK